MRILIVDGTEGYYPQRIEEKPSGGIVTSLTKLSQIWVQRGYQVTIASLAPEGTYKGVRHVSVMNEVPCDIAIFNRNCIRTELIRYVKDCYGAKTVNWLHDIAQADYYEDSAIQKVDQVVALSAYNVDSYSDFFTVPREKFTVIGNGVDKQIFYDTKEERDPNLYITASAPIKGLGPLDYFWYNWRRINPKAILRMYCNQSLHDKSNDSYSRSLQILSDHGVDVRGPVRQRDLADEFRRSWVLLMPNTYPEICSNVLLQARACGLPVIASGIGSVPEYLPSTCYTRRSPVDQHWFWKEFTEKALGLYMDKELHRSLSSNASDGVLDWEEVATQWERKVFYG